MAKAKSARSGRKTAKKRRKAAQVAKKRAKLSRKKAAKRKAPARKAKASARKKAPARRKKAPARRKKKATARRKAPAMKPRRKKAPGRKPAAPKARGKSPVRKKAGKPSRKAAIVEAARKTPALNRERKRLIETDEDGPTSPSSLGYQRSSSSARSGRSELRESLTDHTESSPALTGGDIDADWEDAYATGDESPGGDNPTPDQDRVDDIGKALGVQYNDNEELKGSDKVAERDKHRWELDPASSDDYRDRGKDDED